jgi:hypothetical protein
MIDQQNLHDLLGRAIGDVAHEAGFSSFRRAAQAPFNLIFEARP